MPNNNASKVETCNLAIGYIGHGVQIADFDEDSKEAAACRTFYEPTLKQLFRMAHWPFATKLATLTLVENNPNDEWFYSYRYPVDCVDFRRILSGRFPDDRQSQIAYRIAKDSDGKLIFTNRENAVCEYTEYVDDPTFYNYDFIDAHALLLSTRLIPQFVSGDRKKIRQENYAMFQDAIQVALANAINEEQNFEEPQAESVRARGLYISEDETRIYTNN